MRMDPRLGQITVLSILLLYGISVLHFDISLSQVALTLGSGLFFQWIFFRDLGKFEPRSALISSLSLCLLLRVPSTWFAIVATCLAMGSKRFLRLRGKHLFNPTNFALAVLLIAGGAWLSPAQWGAEVVLSFFFVCCGLLVTQSAARWDIAFGFLGCFAFFLFYRAYSLGDPHPIFWHQLESGALLLFAFFMISDPRSTPNSRSGRMIFGFAVASLAYYIRFKLFNPNALVYSLCLVSVLTPLLDLALPAANFTWPEMRFLNFRPSNAIKKN